ncbi:MAG TPA: YbaK/EbsC family protein [Anaerolineaceae bacterium]|jgi:prolyl-tRNA editing enzyme YbaK/EbsC (Cys-tRNA(Pro) deacylase)
MDTDSTPVTLDLERRRIPYRFFRHTGVVNSVEQAAEERGLSIAQIVRSIVFRTAPETFLMALIAGTDQISWPGLRKYLGQSRITMATEEEVLQFTGYRLGAVSPFGLPAPMRVLVDHSVLIPEVLSIGSGVKNTTVILERADLLRALGEVEIGDFRKAEG